MIVSKIISGGQTGADQAALDVAIRLGIVHGGWIPKGRKTEKGPLAQKYQLHEMATASYAVRSEQNVLDSDGTLIVSKGRLSGGCALTRKFAKKHGRPWIHVDMEREFLNEAANRIRSWVVGNKLKVLNVAGPRASECPGIYQATQHLLEAVLDV